MIMEPTLSSGSEYLITHAARDFLLDTDLLNEEVNVVTPGEFMRMWRNEHGTQKGPQDSSSRRTQRTHKDPRCTAGHLC